MPYHFERVEEINQLELRLIKTDLDLALTLAQIASQTKEREKAIRNQRNARKAYDTIIRDVGSGSLNRSEKDAITKKLAMLKSALLGLGESF